MFCSQQLDFVIHFKIQVQRFAWCFEIFLNKISIFFHFWHLLMDYHFFELLDEHFRMFPGMGGKGWGPSYGWGGGFQGLGVPALGYRPAIISHPVRLVSWRHARESRSNAPKKSETLQDSELILRIIADHWGPDAIWCVFHSVSVSSSFYVCQCVSTWWDCSWTLGELGLEAWFMVLLYFFLMLRPRLDCSSQWRLPEAAATGARMQEVSVFQCDSARFFWGCRMYRSLRNGVSRPPQNVWFYMAFVSRYGRTALS